MRNVQLFAAMVGIVLAVLANVVLLRPTAVPPQTVSVPSAKSDIEKRLADAINAERGAQGRPQATGGAYGGPTAFDEVLASRIASKMKNYPADYNKPALHLGESTPVELVIKTNEKQDTASYFDFLEGEVTEATVLVANDVSAQLSGPPDRLQITLRGDKTRTILSPVPITWV